MPDKPAVSVVPGEWVRLAGSSSPHRRVLGMKHEPHRVLLWLEDPDHPGEPLGPPTPVDVAGMVDAQATA